MDRTFGRTTATTDVLNRLLADLDDEWRIEDPESGTVIGEGVTTFHDAVQRNFAFRCLDRTLLLTIYQFAGSYLSIAVDLPAAMRTRMRPGWRLTARLDTDATRPVTTFVRLNLNHRQTKRVLHEVVVIDQGTRDVGFDLDAVEPGWTGAWLDIIFSHPRMSEICLRGVSLGFEEAA